MRYCKHIASRTLTRCVIGLIILIISPTYFAPTSFASTMPKDTAALNDSDEVERLEVMVKGGYIYITTSRTVTIQLYSILGQLLNQQVIPSGTTRIKAPSRGVFILKAGTITRRVTVNN